MGALPLAEVAIGQEKPYRELVESCKLHNNFCNFIIFIIAKLQQFIYH